MLEFRVYRMQFHHYQAQAQVLVLDAHHWDHSLEHPDEDHPRKCMSVFPVGQDRFSNLLSYYTSCHLCYGNL
jgi:hypothetical protein